jgi:hypothetical protein
MGGHSIIVTTTTPPAEPIVESGTHPYGHCMFTETSFSSFFFKITTVFNFAHPLLSKLQDRVWQHCHQIVIFEENRALAGVRTMMKPLLLDSRLSGFSMLKHRFTSRFGV